jgi:hypothetical protein
VTCKIGERMFGQVSTPERLMAHRLPMMVGLGGLQTAIERFGTIETAATRAAQPPGGDALRRALLNGHPSRRRREGPCPGREAGEPPQLPLVELTFIAGFQIFASKCAKAFHIAPQGISADL